MLSYHVVSKACGWLLLQLARFARRTWAAAVIVAVIPVVIQLVASFHWGFPYPSHTDEFVYLLEADTLAHGNLANPQHPLWRHFEAINELARPSYTGKYPLGSPAFLALGQVFLGGPFWGVLLGMALASAATLWAVRIWTRPAWSLLAGVTVALAFGGSHYWVRSYFGGEVVFLGSMLLIGSYRRLTHSGRTLAAVWFGIGCMLLIFTRPYEGGLLILAALIGITWSWRQALNWNWRLSRTLPVLAIFGLLTLVLLAVTNKAATGNVFRMAYMEHMRQYDRAPLLWTLKPDLGPKTGIPAVRAVHDTWSLDSYHAIADIPWFLRIRQRVGEVRRDVPWSNTASFVSTALALPGLLAGAGFLIFAMAIAFAGLFIETWYLPHYGAPFMALLLVSQFYSLFLIARWKIGRVRAGRFAAVLLVIFVLSGPLLNNAYFLMGKGLPRTGTVYNMLYPEFVMKANIARRLEAIGGAHVVIVHRTEDRQRSLQEWVYNSASIDRQPVIWAQDLGTEGNQDLFQYYKGRQFWLMEPDLAAPGTLPELRKLTP
jgi:hypothetical protein